MQGACTPRNCHHLIFLPRTATGPLSARGASRKGSYRAQSSVSASAELGYGAATGSREEPGPATSTIALGTATTGCGNGGEVTTRQTGDGAVRLLMRTLN